MSFSSLIPAFDCNPRPLLDILIACNKLVNPEASPAVVEDNTVAVVALLDKGKYAANVAAFIPTLLGSKHNFDKESNMEGQWNSIWNEFVASKGLRPVKLAVAGPPKTGKTEHAKTIADRYVGNLNLIFLLQANRNLYNLCFATALTDCRYSMWIPLLRFSTCSSSRRLCQGRQLFLVMTRCRVNPFHPVMKS